MFEPRKATFITGRLMQEHWPCPPPAQVEGGLPAHVAGKLVSRTSKPIGMLAQISIEPGAAHEQPTPISHQLMRSRTPTHTAMHKSTPSHPHRAHTRAHGVCRHNRGGVASMAAAPRQTVQRERDVSDSERRARSPASGAGRICSEIKAHMITREQQAWLWSCRSLRALAGVLRQPKSCTQTYQNPGGALFY
jgi:hypothetical protein